MICGTQLICAFINTKIMVSKTRGIYLDLKSHEQVVAECIENKPNFIDKWVFVCFLVCLF